MRKTKINVVVGGKVPSPEDEKGQWPLTTKDEGAPRREDQESVEERLRLLKRSSRSNYKQEQVVKAKTNKEQIVLVAQAKKSPKIIHLQHKLLSAELDEQRKLLQGLTKLVRCENQEIYEIRRLIRALKRPI